MKVWFSIVRQRFEFKALLSSGNLDNLFKILWNCYFNTEVFAVVVIAISNTFSVCYSFNKMCLASRVQYRSIYICYFKTNAKSVKGSFLYLQLQTLILSLTVRKTDRCCCVVNLQIRNYSPLLSSPFLSNCKIYNNKFNFEQKE